MGKELLEILTESGFLISWHDFVGCCWSYYKLGRGGSAIKNRITKVFIGGLQQCMSCSSWMGVDAPFNQSSVLAMLNPITGLWRNKKVVFDQVLAKKSMLRTKVHEVVGRTLCGELLR